MVPHLHRRTLQRAERYVDKAQLAVEAIRARNTLHHHGDEFQMRVAAQRVEDDDTSSITNHNGIAAGGFKADQGQFVVAPGDLAQVPGW